MLLKLYILWELLRDCTMVLEVFLRVSRINKLLRSFVLFKFIDID